VDQQDATTLLTFAETAAARERGLQAQAVFADLEQRYADVVVALDWIIKQKQSDEALRLISALAQFWTSTKRLDDGAAWSARALALPGGAAATRGRALFDAALMAFWRGDDERATALHTEALAIGRGHGDPTVTALALGGLARIALRTDLAASRRLCRQALAVTAGTADRIGRSGALHVLGAAAQMAGDLTEAGFIMRERITLARQMGDYIALSAECSNLSMVERQLGHLDDADALAREALDISQRRGDEWMIPYEFNGLAALAVERRDYSRAARLIGVAEGLIEAQGAAWPPDERPHYVRTLAALTGALGVVESVQQRADGRALSVREAIDYALGRP
jgi:tetratricopeptide (TPR) repeat protein